MIKHQVTVEDRADLTKAFHNEDVAKGYMQGLLRFHTGLKMTLSPIQVEVPVIESQSTDSFGVLTIVLGWENGTRETLHFEEGEHYNARQALKSRNAL